MACLRWGGAVTKRARAQGQVQRSAGPLARKAALLGGNQGDDCALGQWLKKGGRGHNGHLRPPNAKASLLRAAFIGGLRIGPRLQTQPSNLARPRYVPARRGYRVGNCAILCCSTRSSPISPFSCGGRACCHPLHRGIGGLGPACMKFTA